MVAQSGRGTIVIALCIIQSTESENIQFVRIGAKEIISCWVDSSTSTALLCNRASFENHTLFLARVNREVSIAETVKTNKTVIITTIMRNESKPIVPAAALFTIRFANIFWRCDDSEELVGATKPWWDSGKGCFSFSWALQIFKLSFLKSGLNWSTDLAHCAAGSLPSESITAAMVQDNGRPKQQRSPRASCLHHYTISQFAHTPALLQPSADDALLFYNTHARDVEDDDDVPLSRLVRNPPV